ncbi:response regulator [Vibrio fluvialis]|nr:response regulator [Vibrio fluvialis]
MALVYVVEDEIKIAEILSDYLTKHDYECRIITSGKNAVAEITNGNPDFVILDVMLPEVSGFTICSQLRAMGNEVPIILLTARVDEADRLKGLNIGADDYVCKPFLPNEVVARVSAILRRVQNQKSKGGQHSNERMISYGTITLDMDRFLCIADGKGIDLTPVEFRLLHTMMIRPSRIFSREVLMQTCYTDDRIINDRTIDSHMRNLRKKLNCSGDVIHTIYGVGYKVE